MSEQQALGLLVRGGPALVDPNGIFLNRDEKEKLCNLLADRFKDADIEVIIGAAPDDAILSRLTARHLTTITKRKVVSLYGEIDIDSGDFDIKKGDIVLTNKRVLVVVTALTDVSLVRNMVKAIEVSGSTFVSVGAFCGCVNIGPMDIGYDVSRFVRLTQALSHT